MTKAKQHLLSKAEELVAAAKKINPDMAATQQQGNYNLLMSISANLGGMVTSLRSKDLVENKTPVNEARTSAIIRPTNNQKKVLAKIIAAPTPEVAASEISQGRALVTARDMLAKLGLITIEDNKASVTDLGEEIMRNQNIIDDARQLTPDGEKLAYDKKQTQESLISSFNKTL